MIFVDKENINIRCLVFFIFNNYLLISFFIFDLELFNDECGNY